MRDRLLSRIKAPIKREDWVRVLGVLGNRDLLTIIATRQPHSIGALAEFAGRAQPNVSRALSALAAANLITVEQSGRQSIPRITEFGATKARELGLLDSEGEEPFASADDRSLFAVEFARPSSESVNVEMSDNTPGSLTMWLWLRSSPERCATRVSTDLDALAMHVLRHWWRMLYRRDAPFKLWDFCLEDQQNISYTFLATALGSDLHLSVRSSGGGIVDLANSAAATTVATFETQLLDEFVRPVAAYHWTRGRSARPLHNLLARIEDSRAQPAERTFCRTAGSLGIAPYDLDDCKAAQIRNLIDRIVDEDARLDFGSAVLSDALEDGWLWTKEQLEHHHQRNRMLSLVELRNRCLQRETSRPARAYKRGIGLARAVRQELQLAPDRPVGGLAGLSNLMGAEGMIDLSPKAPGAMRGFQSVEDGIPTVIVEDEGERASAFILARTIGDYLAFGSQASCVANIYTNRQAVGRAFAAEFMAPSEAVIQMIVDEDRAISQVAEHFGVSPSVIHRQYENNSYWI